MIPAGGGEAQPAQSIRLLLSAKGSDPARHPASPHTAPRLPTSPRRWESSSVHPRAAASHLPERRSRSPATPDNPSPATPHIPRPSALSRSCAPHPSAESVSRTVANPHCPPATLDFPQPSCLPRRPPCFAEPESGATLAVYRRCPPESPCTHLSLQIPLLEKSPAAPAHC